MNASVEVAEVGGKQYGLTPMPLPREKPSRACYPCAAEYDSKLCSALPPDCCINFDYPGKHLVWKLMPVA